MTHREVLTTTELAEDYLTLVIELFKIYLKIVSDFQKNDLSIVSLFVNDFIINCKQVLNMPKSVLSYSPIQDLIEHLRVKLDSNCIFELTDEVHTYLKLASPTLVNRRHAFNSSNFMNIQTDTAKNQNINSILYKFYQNKNRTEQIIGNDPGVTFRNLFKDIQRQPFFEKYVKDRKSVV